MKTANYNYNLTEGWHFHLGEAKRLRNNRHNSIYSFCKAGGALGKDDAFLMDNAWKPVHVPHDWLTEQPYDKTAAPTLGFKHRTEGWYYKKLDLPEEEIARARLVFEGVLGQTTVYVNGTVAGRNMSGYNRFSCEIASYLLPGETNLIALYVDGRTFEAWSYEGAGLYRPVRIEFRAKTRIEGDGCFVRSEETDGAWSVNADLSLSGLDPASGMTVVYALRDPNGAVVASGTAPACERIALALPVSDPMLWSPESPRLYAFSCELRSGAETIDSFSASVGLRTVEWIPNEGMYLNGKPYRIKGICCHQDHGGVGAAVTPAIMEYRIRRLKALGVNAYRCAHHAVPEDFLAICDRLGMLVMVENRHFSVSEDTKQQLASLVRAARNHPSVFLYSLFNEEPWQSDVRGYRMAREMREWVRSLDDTRAVTGAMNGGILRAVNASDALDVIGVNYDLREYAAAHARSPQKVILGTENCPTYATRGECKTDLTVPVYSGYGDEWAKSFSESLTETMECAERMPYDAGHFVWSGFDSYGEPQPHEWPSVMSHWGVYDCCGFPKDTAYLLRAWYSDALTVHVLPHWNHRDGETVRVCAFTNGDTAELYLNGRSLGAAEVKERRAEWQVPYEAGTVRVVARRGAESAFDEVETTGKAAQLRVFDATPKGHKADVRILNVSVTDADGNVIPDCAETVYFTAKGMRILGVSNGDPNGQYPMVDGYSITRGGQSALLVTHELPLFHGRGQVIVSDDPGSFTVRAAGFDPVTLGDAVMPL
jgi:beta-galactosidase